MLKASFQFSASSNWCNRDLIKIFTTVFTSLLERIDYQAPNMYTLFTCYVEVPSDCCLWPCVISTILFPWWCVISSVFTGAESPLKCQKCGIAAVYFSVFESFTSHIYLYLCLGQCCVIISRSWSAELCDCVVSYCASSRTTESALFLYSDSDLESPFANTVLYVFSLRFLAQCLLTGSRKKKTYQCVALVCFWYLYCKQIGYFPKVLCFC